MPKIHLKNKWITLCTEGILSEEQVAEIAKPTPKEFIYSRKGRSGMELDYIDIDYVITKLNAIFGHNWDIFVKEFKIYFEAAEEVIVLVSLTARTEKGSVTKEAFGSSVIKKTKDKQYIVSVGDDLKSAQSDAIKKVGSLLGIGWDIFAGLSRDKSLDKERDADAKEEKKDDPKKKTTAKKKDDSTPKEKADIVDKLQAKLKEQNFDDPQEYMEWLFHFQKDEELNFVVYDPELKKYVFNGMDKDSMKALMDNIKWTFDEYIEAAKEGKDE